jgi:Zn finger protein HypA/HybF involved in hydrogenase expression
VFVDILISMSRKPIEVDVTNLAEVIKTSFSISEVMRKICGHDTNNAERRFIKREIVKQNLSTSHFTGPLWSKGKTSLQDDRLGLLKLEEMFCEHSMVSRSHIKELIIKNKLLEYKCKKCGTNQWMDSPLTLHLDHINGISNDHRLDNLRFLCPNCHSQTETYCARTQNRYSDEQILEASVGAKSIREVMVKVGMSTGTNYTRVKKLLPNLYREDIYQKKLSVVPKEKVRSTHSIKNKSSEWKTRIGLSLRRVPRPSKEELEKMINEKSIVKIGKDFGLTGNSIKKWCKKYGIQTKPVGYWSKEYAKVENNLASWRNGSSVQVQVLSPLPFCLAS